MVLGDRSCVTVGRRLSCGVTGVPSESPPKPETPHPKGVKQGALLVGKPEPDISAGDRRRLRGATCRDGLRASRWKCFNPRAPYGARRPPNARNLLICFNPRAPYGARPHQGPVRLPRRCCFNPRAPYGARPARDWMSRDCARVSIHAPRTGRDVSRGSHLALQTMFQSTRPVRGATKEIAGTRALHVSIHAPRTGRDRRIVIPHAIVRFNPRAPYGARPRKPAH